MFLTSAVPRRAQSAINLQAKNPLPPPPAHRDVLDDFRQRDQASRASWLSSMYSSLVPWLGLAGRKGKAGPTATAGMACADHESVTAEMMLLDVKSWMLMPIENRHASPEVIGLIV